MAHVFCVYFWLFNGKCTDFGGHLTLQKEEKSATNTPFFYQVKVWHFCRAERRLFIA
jgi:hypothetical protein